MEKKTEITRRHLFACKEMNKILDSARNIIGDELSMIAEGIISSCWDSTQNIPTTIAFSLCTNHNENPEPADRRFYDDLFITVFTSNGEEALLHLDEASRCFQNTFSESTREFVRESLTIMRKEALRALEYVNMYKAGDGQFDDINLDTNAAGKYCGFQVVIRFNLEYEGGKFATAGEHLKYGLTANKKYDKAKEDIHWFALNQHDQVLHDFGHVIEDMYGILARPQQPTEE